MSLIAQARLALLSQRCLSTAIRRDGYVYLNNYQYQHPLKRHTERPMLADDCQQHIPHRELHSNSQIESISLKGICKLNTECNTPRSSRRRDSALDCILVRDFVDRAGNANLPIKNTPPNQLIDIKFRHLLSSIELNKKTTYNHNSLQFQPFRTLRYLLPDARQSKRSLKRIFQTYYSYYKRHRDSWRDSGAPNDRYGHNDRQVGVLISMLSVLGLFMTADDIEDEKNKLTDEQKMKKMKPAELLIAKGVLAMCDQAYQNAAELFHKALNLAQDDKNEEQETLILNLLACNCFESGDLESAEKLFIDLMKRLLAHNVAQTDPAMLELSLKLASIYSRSQATHEKAMKGFKFVINSLLEELQDLLSNVEELELHDISEDKKNELALLGWSYDWFAKYLLATNDFNGAADMLHRALQISSKVLGPLHDQTLILLNDVGTTMAMNGSPEEGRTFIKKAVEGAIETQSKELASFYVNLGLVALKLRKLSEAKRYCEYSIELALKNREHHNCHEVIELSRSCLNQVQRLLEVDNK